MNFIAAKRIVLAVSGGASITMDEGSFTAQCPGKITVQEIERPLLDRFLDAARMQP